MQYPVADIVEQVKILLDQNQLENSIIAQEDNTLELDAIIRQKILHAARLLLETSDVSVIDGKTCFIKKYDDDGQPANPDWPDPEPEGKIIDLYEDTTSTYGDLSAWVLSMPDDYLRLLSLKMSDWKRAVHSTIPYESAEYSQLRSGFIGITGNPERPAVAETKRGMDHVHISESSAINPGGTEWSLENVKWLEIYTSATGDVVDFRYCPIPAYEDINTAIEGATPNYVEFLDFPEKLYRHLLYQTGSFVAATYKDTALAQLLMNMVYEGEPESKEEQ